MRVSIERHLRDKVEQLASQLGTQNPSVAVNYIVNQWVSGQVTPPVTSFPTSTQPQEQASDDEFAALLDWGSPNNI